MSSDKTKDTSTSGDWIGCDAVDAHHARVRWHVSANGMMAARTRLARLSTKPELILRVTQKPKGAAARALDIPIRKWFDERLVLLGEAGASHTFAVGLRGGNAPGAFFVAIARSQL